MEIILGIWIFFGLLAYGQFLMTLGVSVQFQKELSKKLENCTGYSIIEDLALMAFLVILLCIFVTGGIFSLVFSHHAFRQVLNKRLKIEKISQKIFGYGWCN